MNYDVILIGAGSVGLSTSHALARGGMRVLVLDRLASFGQGSNKAAIGGIRATHGDPAKIRLGLRSLEIVKSWQETYGHDLEWTTGGYVFVARREREREILKNLLKVQQSYGLNIDWHEQKSLLEIVPDLRQDGLLGGTYSPEDGHCSTLRLAWAQFDVSQRAGVEFRFREEVQEILREGDCVTGVRTSKGKYHAPVVVNAAGAAAAHIGHMLGFDHPVQADSHEAGITEPVAPFMKPMVVDIRPTEDSANYYFYQLHTGQVVFCITPNPAIVGEDCRETSAFLPQVARRMVDLMPRLSNLRVRRTWRGLYPMTPDGSPLVGWSRELRGYLMAIGMCGQGFMLGPGLGELLARMLQDTLQPEDEIILETLSPYREFRGAEALK